jgi:hypothetical protein
MNALTSYAEQVAAYMLNRYSLAAIWELTCRPRKPTKTARAGDPVDPGHCRCCRADMAAPLDGQPERVAATAGVDHNIIAIIAADPYPLLPRRRIRGADLFPYLASVTPSFTAFGR